MKKPKTNPDLSYLEQWSSFSAITVKELKEMFYKLYDNINEEHPEWDENKCISKTNQRLYTKCCSYIEKFVILTEPIKISCKECGSKIEKIKWVEKIIKNIANLNKHNTKYIKILEYEGNIIDLLKENKELQKIPKQLQDKISYLVLDRNNLLYINTLVIMNKSIKINNQSLSSEVNYSIYNYKYTYCKDNQKWIIDYGRFELYD